MKYIVLFLFVFTLTACGTSNRTTSKKRIAIEQTKESSPKILAQNSIDTSSKKFNHMGWTNLLQKHVTNQGLVDYKGFKTNKKSLQDYLTTLNNHLPVATSTKEYTLAFWINAYNAMTVDLIIRNYPLKSIKDIKNPWEQHLWKLGGKWYSLNEIEHQILRKMKEPRIHFAIVCASYSCPKLLNEAYSASALEPQLNKATKGFLLDKERNNISQNKIEVSKIFKWFAKDFKSEDTLIDFLNKYSEINISKSAKKSYKDYNWNLNE